MSVAKRTIITIIESPYAGDVPYHIAYARAAVRDSLLRGELPYASHLLYTQPGVLRDENVEERDLGLQAGLRFKNIPGAVTVFYRDLGMSRGMKLAEEMCIRDGNPHEYRILGPDWYDMHLQERLRGDAELHWEYNMPGTRRRTK